MNLRETVRRHRVLLISGMTMGMAGAAAKLARPWMLARLIEAVALDRPIVQALSGRSRSSRCCSSRTRR
ncbi:hypothetical protein ACWGDX_05335 [Streptomyces sp. NPDC055025]